MLGSLWFNSFSSGAGASADYELISTSVLGSNQTSVTFTDSGAWTPYKHLQIRYVARSTVSNTADNLTLRFNGDTSGTSYSTHLLYGDGSSAASAAFNSGNGARSFIYVASAITAASALTYNFAPGVVDILDFASTSKNTTTRALGGYMDSNIASRRVGLFSGLWINTAAVTSISVGNSADFLAGSRFSLYGLKG